MEARDKPAVLAMDLDLHLIDLSHPCRAERCEWQVKREMQVVTSGAQLHAVSAV